MTTRAATVQERPPVPREILVLVAAAFVIAVGFGLISPVLPQFAQSFDVTVAAATVIVSAFAFFRLLFAPAGGALVTRLGERPVYLTGLVIVALSTGASAFAQSYWQLLVFRSLGGIGSTMFTVSAMALLVRMAPPVIRGKVSSMYGSAFLVGGVIGPVIGGLLGELGMRVPFVVYGIALLIAAGFVGVMLRGAHMRPDPTRTELAPMTVREARHNSAYRAAMVSAFANGWTNFGVRVAVLPLFAVAVVGETWAAGVALAVGAGATALTLQFSGRLADTVGRRPPIMVGLALSALGMGTMGLSGGLVLILVLSTVVGAGAGLLNPAQQASVADVVGNDRSGGKVLAGYQMCQDAGGIGGPILVGLVADYAGWGWAFALSGVISALAILPWLRAQETLAVH
ncbi:MFS transporter [Janibacter sp. DB-40]|uniref:MFS transporter n=1 Tax=Janibacter sp. DB-40 TaxID=3028808 RepID=UPI0024051AAE|nr:MFS transporter [Janibacter sp. DB-40]